MFSVIRDLRNRIRRYGLWYVLTNGDKMRRSYVNTGHTNIDGKDFGRH